MAEPTELLPCPFCGGINIIHCGHHMYCHACGADGPDADTQYESDARAAWNRRTPQPTQAQAGAVPLTDAQIESLLWTYGYDPDDEHMAAMLKEAHGIKGGQHGTDTRSN